MNFRYSQHAEEEMLRRGITRDIIDAVLLQPEQTVSAGGHKLAYQSKVLFGCKTFLVRVVVAHDVVPPLVVTVYRTSKIDTYWKPS